MPINKKKDVVPHNSDEVFKSLIADAEKTHQVDEGASVDQDSLTSDEQLTDYYSPEEQKERSKSISAILRHYEDSYNSKVSFQRVYRHILFWGCSLIILAFAVLVICLAVFGIRNANEIEITGVVTIITAILSLVVSILELVKTITKYCFPENDEEYIVKIVESVQSNDLEKLKEINRSEEARDKHCTD